MTEVYNQRELQEVNKIYTELEAALKKAGFLLVLPNTQNVELEVINGKFFIGRIKLEVIPIKKEPGEEAITEKNQFYAIPVRTLEQPATKNTIDVYSQSDDKLY